MRRIGPTEAEQLDRAWDGLAEAIRRRPRLARGLMEGLERALLDPSELAGLDGDEAQMVARLAHVGLGEILLRANGDRQR